MGSRAKKQLSGKRIAENWQLWIEVIDTPARRRSMSCQGIRYGLDYDYAEGCWSDAAAYFAARHPGNRSTGEAIAYAELILRGMIRRQVRQLGKWRPADERKPPRYTEELTGTVDPDAATEYEIAMAIIAASALAALADDMERGAVDLSEKRNRLADAFRYASPALRRAKDMGLCGHSLREAAESVGMREDELSKHFRHIGKKTAERMRATAPRRTAGVAALRGGRSCPLQQP